MYSCQHFEEYDTPIWETTKNGVLTFKEAFKFLSLTNDSLHWAKTLWWNCIPPARLIMLWKFINGMLPTIDVLAKVLYYTF